MKEDNTGRVGRELHALLVWNETAWKTGINGRLILKRILKI
jgi:hypothetical protein